MFSRMFKSRPAMASALTIAVLAVGLLVVPISYQRTTGYDVSLSLAGAGIEQAQLMEIAQSYKETLGSGSVMVDAVMEDEGSRYVLKTSAPSVVRTAAGAFASELSELGYDAAVEVTPIHETVSTSVAAYAYGRIIEISVDGKSSAELENEIRNRLAAAGVTAQVSVTHTDDKHQEIKINAERQALGTEGHEAMPELVLTKDGKPMTGGFGVNVMKKKVGESGAMTLVVKVKDEGKVVEAEVPNAESMSDAAIAASIEAQLAAKGLAAVVQVNGNQISVEKRKP